MNSTIVRTQLWELWRLTRLELLLRLLTPLVFFFLCGYLPILEGVVYFGVVLTSVTSQLWLQGFDQRQRGGFPFILNFTQPVPTRWLVGVPMAWLLISNCLLYMALVSTARLFLSVPYPGWTMLPFLLTVSACLAATTWSTTRFGERAVVTIGMIAVLAFWLRPKLVLTDPLAAEPTTLSYIMEFTLVENGILAMVTMIAMGLTLYFVRNQRCGEFDTIVGEGVARVPRYWEGGGSRRQFLSSLHAQVWFEWQRVRVRAMVAVLGGLASMVFFSWLLRGDPGEVVFGTLGAIYLFSMLALILLVTEGVLGMKYRAKVLRLSVYEATQPISVGSSIVLKLGVIGGLLLVGNGVLFLGGICCVTLLSDSEVFEYAIARAEDLTRWGVIVWIGCGFAAITSYILACLTAIHLAMGLGYSAPWVEKHRAVPVLGMLFLLFPLFVGAVEVLMKWELQFLYEPYLFAWGILLVTATVFSVFAVLQRGIYRTFPVALIVVFWVAYLALLSCGAILLANPAFASLSIYAVVFIIGLCCIPIGSLAWAPLSLATQRNQ